MEARCSGWSVGSWSVGTVGALLVVFVTAGCAQGKESNFAPGPDLFQVSTDASAPPADGVGSATDGEPAMDATTDSASATDSEPPVKPVCLPTPLPLSRFTKKQRTSSTGRVFGGWGGGAAATLAAPQPAQRVPVIFVHGNGGTAGDFLGLHKALCKQGYTDQEIWAITFQDNSCFGTCLSGSNTQHATELAQMVTLVRSVTKAKRVAIVAVSMGVTTTRYYLKFLGGLGEAALAYLVSGPNHGLASCDLAGSSSINVACAEVATLTTYSGWLHDLNSPDETPSGQGDGLPAIKTVLYRVLTYALDPYFVGLYTQSPLLAGADNLTLSGALHGQPNEADLLAYLAKINPAVP